jgi:hypothetical protein
MESDVFKFSTYAELSREHIRETIKRDLEAILGSMPESTNDHKKVSMEYRIDRIMECVDIIRSPSASLEEKARARKKKYKLLHPDRANAQQNERRRRNYQENKNGYADKARETAREFRNTHQEYRSDAIQRSNIDHMEKKNYILSKLGGSCVLCGNQNRSELEVHHVDPEEKEYFIHDIRSIKYRDILDEELKKCVLLCEPCHLHITNLQKFLRSCENTNMSIENLFGILRDHKEGKSIGEISVSRGIDYLIVKGIISGERFKHLTQIGTPYITPPFFNFDTFYRLQEYVRMREYNRQYANQLGYFPIAPLNVDASITPYNLDKMDTKENELGVFYSIPGAKCVTPFDFDECEG